MNTLNDGKGLIRVSFVSLEALMNTLKGSIIRVSLGDCCDNDGYIEIVNQAFRDARIRSMDSAVVSERV